MDLAYFETSAGFSSGKREREKKIDCMPEHAILYPDELVRREGYYVLTPPLH